MHVRIATVRFGYGAVFRLKMVESCLVFAFEYYYGRETLPEVDTSAFKGWQDPQLTVPATDYPNSTYLCPADVFTAMKAGRKPSKKRKR